MNNLEYCSTDTEGSLSDKMSVSVSSGRTEKDEKQIIKKPYNKNIFNTKSLNVTMRFAI